MMAQIIQFPARPAQENTTAFLNMVELFKVCEDLKSCNFYLEAVEKLHNDEKITEKEMYTLRRIGRTKRIDLAHPKRTKQDVTGAGEYLYTPEMGQQKPDCQIEASLSYYGSYYHLKTALDLKGRGITLNEVKPDGVKWYTVTKRAYELLKNQYTISYKSLLD
ncbi:MAG: hypothetical protein K6G30_02375 [Acetatifactor sp.]|nr:hypothetical protein [Acetatifactor sp.]